MTRDYLVSFIAEGFAVVLALLAYRVAAAQWTADDFGEYALARKIVSAVLVIALVGCDLAVVRFIAFEAAGIPTRIAGYVSGAVIVALAAAAALTAVLLVLSAPLSVLLFAAGGHEDVVIALAAVGSGGALQGIAYGYERGQLHLGRAALLLMANTGAVPLLAVTLAPSPALALAAMGAGWAAVGGTAIIAQRAAFAARPVVGPVFRYGAPRAVGLLLQMGFLAAPAIVAAHRFGIAEAGNVAFALLVLGLLSTLLTPIGVVLMPRSAKLLRERSSHALGRHVRRLLAIVVPAIAIAVLVIEIGADAMITAFLGPSYASAAPALRGIVWAAIPWTFFVTLRGLLDAHDVRPLNTRNVGVASAGYAGIVAVASVLTLSEAAYHLAFVAAVTVLAGLTLIDARRAVAQPLLAEPVVEEPLQR